MAESLPKEIDDAVCLHYGVGNARYRLLVFLTLQFLTAAIAVLWAWLSCDFFQRRAGTWVLVGQPDERRMRFLIEDAPAGFLTIALLIFAAFWSIQVLREGLYVKWAIGLAATSIIWQAGVFAIVLIAYGPFP